MILLLNFNP